MTASGSGICERWIWETAALEQILAREKDDVLVVTHSAVLMALRCYLADRPFDVMREYRTRNTELVRVTEEEIREAIRRYGRAI